MDVGGGLGHPANVGGKRPRAVVKFARSPLATHEYVSQRLGPSIANADFDQQQLGLIAVEVVPGVHLDIADPGHDARFVIGRVHRHRCQLESIRPVRGSAARRIPPLVRFGRVVSCAACEHSAGGERAVGRRRGDAGSGARVSSAP